MSNIASRAQLLILICLFTFFTILLLSQCKDRKFFIKLFCLLLFSRNQCPHSLHLYQTAITSIMIIFTITHVRSPLCSLHLPTQPSELGLQWLPKNLGRNSIIKSNFRLYGVYQQPLPFLILKSSTLILLQLPFLLGELFSHLAHINFLLETKIRSLLQKFIPLRQIISV